MPPARPQQMSDPADKSDDLIAELAKLMAAAPGGSKPARRADHHARAARAPRRRPRRRSAPSPIRIPGIDAAASEAGRRPRQRRDRTARRPRPAPSAFPAWTSRRRCRPARRSASSISAGRSRPLAIKQEPLSSLSRAPRRRQNPSRARRRPADAVARPHSVQPDAGQRESLVRRWPGAVGPSRRRLRAPMQPPPPRRRGFQLRFRLRPESAGIRRAAASDPAAAAAAPASSRAGSRSDRRADRGRHGPRRA